MEHPICFPVIIYDKEHMFIICLRMTKNRAARKTLMLTTAVMTLSFCISGFSETLTMQLQLCINFVDLFGSCT